MIMNELIAKYAEFGLNLEMNPERIVAHCSKPSRSRLGVKYLFNYRFRSVERMNEYVAEYIANHAAAIAANEARKAARKSAGAEMAAKVAVGDIFVSSWGWEQTNVDFYQVVEKPSANTVIVREIAAATVEGSEGYMSRNVRAVPNAFRSAPIKKRLTNGGFKISSFQSARPTTADKEHYNSWYA
jgi:hypothetical protein